MLRNRRPVYLQNADQVYDALSELKEGYIADLVKKTRLTYAEVSQAAKYLRERGRIQYERHGRKIHYSMKP